MASSTLVVVDRGIAFSMSSSIGANGPAVILLLSSDSVSLSDWRVVGLEVPRRGCAGDWSVGSMHGRTFERRHGRCPVVVRSRAGGVLGSLPAARLSRAPVGEETAPCPRGQRPFSTTADELVVIFHDGIGLQDREVSQLGLAERWLPRRFTMRPILGWVPRLRGKRAAHRVGVALVDMG